MNNMSDRTTGLIAVSGECRKHVEVLRNSLQYARDLSFRDPRRSVEALRRALDELDDLAVDVEILLANVGQATLPVAAGEAAGGGVAARGEWPASKQERVPAVAEVKPVPQVRQLECVSEVAVRALDVIDRAQASAGVKAAAQGLEGGAVLSASARTKYVPEQQEVIESNAHDCAVDAGAGTGKSTTLDGYARARPRERMLYVAFTRSVADHAKTRFPSNVRCVNQHSLAFADVGHKYRDKLGKPKARQVVSYLVDKKRMALSVEGDQDAFAQLALDAIDEYLAGESWSYEITARDVEDGYLLPSGRHVEGRHVAAAAQAVWEGMQDVDERRVSMVPDGYAKLWALSRPNMSRYSRILLDEGQDANGALLQVLLSQDCGRVFVGDEHQSIFGFRRAVNAMKRLPQAAQFQLTHSFRFGPEIAGVANDLLGTFLPGGLTLVGAAKERKPDGSCAALFRTNAALFAAAADWITQRDARSGGKTSLQSASLMSDVDTDGGLHLVGGVESYQFGSIVDAFNMRAGKRSAVRDEFMRRFDSYAGLQGYAEQVKDKELLARISVVERFGDRVPYLAEEIKAAHVEAQRANISLCSAHKSKGLEWDRVLLADDFQALMSKQGLPKAMSFTSCEEEVMSVVEAEEIRLLYVAITRARMKLTPSRGLEEFLTWKKNEAPKVGALVTA